MALINNERVAKYEYVLEELQKNTNEVNRIEAAMALTDQIWVGSKPLSGASMAAASVAIPPINDQNGLPIDFVAGQTLAVSILNTVTGNEISHNLVLGAANGTSYAFTFGTLGIKLSATGVLTVANTANITGSPTASQLVVTRIVKAKATTVQGLTQGVANTLYAAKSIETVINGLQTSINTAVNQVGTVQASQNALNTLANKLKDIGVSNGTNIVALETMNPFGAAADPLKLLASKKLVDDALASITPLILNYNTILARLHNMDTLNTTQTNRLDTLDGVHTTGNKTLGTLANNDRVVLKANLDNEIATVNGRIDSNVIEIADIKGDVSDNQNDILDLDDRVTANATEIINTNNIITDVNNDLISLAEIVDTNTTDILDIRTKVNALTALPTYSVTGNWADDGQGGKILNLGMLPEFIPNGTNGKPNDEFYLRITSVTGTAPSTANNHLVYFLQNGKYYFLKSGENNTIPLYAEDNINGTQMRFRNIVGTNYGVKIKVKTPNTVGGSADNTDYFVEERVELFVGWNRFDNLASTINTNSFYRYTNAARHVYFSVVDANTLQSPLIFSSAGQAEFYEWTTNDRDNIIVKDLMTGVMSSAIAISTTQFIEERK